MKPGLNLLLSCCQKRLVPTIPIYVTLPAVYFHHIAWKLKGQIDATDWFVYCKSYCSLNMFRAPLCPSPGAQDLYRYLLHVVIGALVYRLLVWCGDVGYMSGLRGVSRETSRKPDT